jgi:hypothetical protein
MYIGIVKENLTVCAVITAKGTSIHHKNTKENNNILGSARNKLLLNKEMMNIMKNEFFPNFYVDGHKTERNPLNRKTTKLKRSYITT